MEIIIIIVVLPGDSMMYQHSVGGGVGCGGNGSPTATTPPNMNSCSSVTPPLTNQPNPSQTELNGEMVSKWRPNI